jgi:hypothetical protein
MTALLLIRRVANLEHKADVKFYFEIGLSKNNDLISLAVVSGVKSIKSLMKESSTAKLSIDHFHREEIEKWYFFLNSRK